MEWQHMLEEHEFDTRTLLPTRKFIHDKFYGGEFSTELRRNQIEISFDEKKKFEFLQQSIEIYYLVRRKTYLRSGV